ncbi:hypothetical protein SAMD00019534_054900 [Acytostelium subglobosum LB1]|uniref:hypothetical protein n=1 Tax=Acytostelium subglobosum LB1 TaxID=1410327 RepID=UPI000644B363|nr:hypothetical protein SAMD00019534_054900 [Acytostelium subglobosum LB1]GAM22315.1 hypothetical protein SAMD00019534_054900 [Acytostelium subglobosum LB1]|eukprot:XP_012754435.1 hypothetical protein SAMD00019534_054900 [Acytostelium subglobosum LB1]
MRVRYPHRHTLTQFDVETIGLETYIGGLEILFSNKKNHSYELNGRDTIPLKELVHWMRDNHVKERPELFVDNGTVRPGILVLINDADWELDGGIDYVVEDGDTISFISTLHGG